MRKIILAPLLATLALGACEPTTANPTPKTPASVADASAASTTPTAPAAASHATDVHPVEPGGSVQPAAKASNAFGFKLYQQVGDAQGNLAFSPASISIALAMTYAGARADTAKEMKTALSFPAASGALHGGWASILSGWQTAADVEISVANRLYGEQKYSFEAPFLKLTHSSYGAPLMPVDFAGTPQVQRKRINDWVALQTHDRIEDLLPADGVTADTRMALVNAMYFKSKWASPFLPTHTTQAVFATPHGSVNVPMMSQSERMAYAEIDGVKLAERSYANREFAAVFVLPDSPGELAAVEKKLDAKRFATWTSALSRQQVSMTLPRFQIEPKEPVELSKSLKALGMLSAFDPNTADFTAMANPANPADRLFVEKVFHKTFVAMDEAGTEAAAATAVTMGRTGGALTGVKEFRADRPFLFFIRNVKTGLVMFAGRVVDPSK
jgi:serpin B